MQGREIGCKTLGCGVAVLIVLVSFYGMLAATEKIAKKAKAKITARNTQTAILNLQAVAISFASYEAATGHLPPLTSPDALKNALSPQYLNDTSVLIDPQSHKPLIPNAIVSEKKRSAIHLSPGNVFLLTTEPNTSGIRTVLFLSGQVQAVNPSLWNALNAPETPLPAPAGTTKATPSPVPSPK